MEMWKCGSKGKILLGKFQYFKEIFEKMFLTDTLAKTSKNIFAYSFVSEHTKHIILFDEKKIAFLLRPLRMIRFLFYLLLKL